MNSRDRSRVKSQSLSSAAAACFILLAPYAVSKAAVEPYRGAIYTASDFKRLAAGVDPGFSGDSDCVGLGARNRLLAASGGCRRHHSQSRAPDG